MKYDDQWHNPYQKVLGLPEVIRKPTHQSQPIPPPQSPKYEINNCSIEGVEQFKYFERLNRAAARQQQIYNIYNNNFLQLEQKKKANNEVRMLEEFNRRVEKAN